MALNGLVKDELSRFPVSRPCCRKAEVSATLRFAGGLHILDGRIVVDAQLDSDNAARRLCQQIVEVFGPSPELIALTPGGPRRERRYLVRVVRDGETLARQTGLLDARGRPVRGLPPRLVSGPNCDAEAVWRGAFLAHGSLTVPGRSCALAVTCPGPEAALALVGAARRIGVASKTRQVQGVDRVMVRGDDTIGAMLTRLGALDAARAWQEHRLQRQARATAHRSANFDDANLRRAERAAAVARAEVERAMEFLGDDIPEHLRAAGQLRLDHEQVSLEELGRFADPPITKDAVAGRIRRLLRMADKRAAELAVPGTAVTFSPDLLDA